MSMIGLLIIGGFPYCVTQAGTEDGCVIMYRITEDGVEYERSFQKQEGMRERMSFTCRIPYS